MKKRVLMIFLIAVFITAMSYAAGTIKVKSPTSRTCLEKGSTVNIEWERVGYTGTHVKINFFHDGIVPANYVGGSQIIVANSGSTSWYIDPAKFSVGKTYYFRVKGIKKVNGQWQDVGVNGDSDPLYIFKVCKVIDPRIFKAYDPWWWIHGPGPMRVDLSKVKQLFEKENYKRAVIVKLFRGKSEVMSLGTFKPVVRRGRVAFNTMPSMFNLRLSPEQREMIQAHPQEYRLVIMSKGEVLLNKALRVKAPKRGKVINSKLTMINPNIVKNARFIKKCPDLAVVDIKFTIVRKYSQFRGRVRITGIVKNVGNADYISHKGQQAIILDKGDSRYRLKRVDFKDLKVGKTIKISYERDWNSSSPNEGEFPPTYRVYLSYDPDIGMDNLKTNDDCNPNNNSKTKNGKAINDMLR
jgi:hypothetical protein